MAKAKSVGIPKTVFIVGLIAAILASSLISAAIVTQLPTAKGPKGDKGDKGDTGATGGTGTQGPASLSSPAYTIGTNGTYYYAQDAYGNIPISNSDASPVTRYAVNHGASVLLEDGTYFFSTVVTLNNYTTIEGSGYNTTFSPTGNNSIFQIVAPATRIILRDFEICDNNISGNATAIYNTSGTTTAIYLDNTNGAISLCLFENIQMYHYANAIRTHENPNNSTDCLRSCTFRTVYANEYRSEGFVFYSAYDCRFEDMLATGYDNVSSTNAFRFQNTIDSGSMLSQITALGKTGNDGSGITFSDVSNVYGQGLISDSFEEGLNFSLKSDYVVLSGVEVRSCKDQGIYLDSTNGRVTINGLNALFNSGYGVQNLNHGGNITVLGGEFGGNGAGNYSLINGDQLAYSDGAGVYPNATAPLSVSYPLEPVLLSLGLSAISVVFLVIAIVMFRKARKSTVQP